MDGERNMFSGILVCADCGSYMQYHFNQKNPDIKYFNCYGYNRGKRKKFNVYAKTREECEILLAEMIPKVKAEIAEAKAKLKASQSA